jgi:hypothetical protein
MTSSTNNPAYDLFKLYWKLCLGDILFHLGVQDGYLTNGYPATASAKALLHDFHKRVLGYESISGFDREQMSVFLAEMVLFWAHHGIFVRTSRRQPLYIEDMDLFDEIVVEGKKVRVWDLL